MNSAVRRSCAKGPWVGSGRRKFFSRSSVAEMRASAELERPVSQTDPRTETCETLEATSSPLICRKEASSTETVVSASATERSSASSRMPSRSVDIGSTSCEPMPLGSWKESGACCGASWQTPMGTSSSKPSDDSAVAAVFTASSSPRCDCAETMTAAVRRNPSPSNPRIMNRATVSPQSCWPPPMSVKSTTVCGPAGAASFAACFSCMSWCPVAVEIRLAAHSLCG